MAALIDDNVADGNLGKSFYDWSMVQYVRCNCVIKTDGNSMT